MRTGVALGSNLGDRLANLRTAKEAVLNLHGVAKPILASAIYETDPIACEPAAEKFLNAVLEFDYQGTAADLLKQLQRIEQSLGRERLHARNVSRQIDLDLLYCGEIKADAAELQLPHPQMHLRKFVLQPLVDIRPDLILPNQALTVRELLARVNDSGKVVRFNDQW